MPLPYEAGVSTAFFSGKVKLRHAVHTEALDAYSIRFLPDASIAVMARSHLEAVQPGLMVVHLPNVDRAGHQFGWGSDEQKSKFLPALVSGDHLGALAMSEAGSGSDVMGMRTTAQRDGDDYVLNGSKTFITNAPYADTHVVYAKIDHGDGTVTDTNTGLTWQKDPGSKKSYADAVAGAAFLRLARAGLRHRRHPGGPDGRLHSGTARSHLTTGRHDRG